MTSRVVYDRSGLVVGVFPAGLPGGRYSRPAPAVTVVEWGMVHSLDGPTFGEVSAVPPWPHAEYGPLLRLCDTYRKADWLKVRDVNGQVCIVRRKAA